MRKLETTVDLLDALQERYGWTSDRQIAIGLGVPTTTVSSWRRGRSFPTEVHALVLARALEIPPAMVLVIAAADRTDDHEARAEWQKIVRQIARSGVGVLAALLVTTAHYSPVETRSAVERPLCYMRNAQRILLSRIVQQASAAQSP